MTPEQIEKWKKTIGSAVRHLLGGVSMLLVRKGWVTADQSEFLMDEAIAATISLITIVWAYFNNKTQVKTVIAALHAQPGTSLETVKERVANS